MKNIYERLVETDADGYKLHRCRSSTYNKL